MWSKHGSSLLLYSLPLSLPEKILISHPFTDGHLSVERTVLRLAGYKASQSGGAIRVALGASFSQSLARDYLTSRSFYIFFVPIVRSLYPIDLLHIDGHISSLALKITPVHLLAASLLSLASQCDAIESEMDASSFILNTYKKLLRAHCSISDGPSHNTCLFQIIFLSHPETFMSNIFSVLS